MAVRILWWARACVLVMVVHVPAQAPPVLKVTWPTEGAYVSGMVVIEAILVPLAAEGNIARMTFFADGTSICSVTRRPYKCSWNAGPTVEAHQVRVVAEMKDGTRVLGTVRTRGVHVDEAAGVAAVHVTATVKDRAGRFVRGLKPADFTVSEAGVAQRITGFAAEQAEVSLALTLDTSGSMAAALPTVKELAKAFLRPLPTSWPVPVLAFDNSVFVISPAGSAPEERDRMIDLLQPWGGTALYNAILRSLREVDAGEGRKAVVVFTDGDDQHSTVSPDDVRKAIERSDAVVYFVASGAAAQNKPMMALVEDLARISGGRVLRGRNDKDLAAAFDEVREEIRNQYLLTYVPKKLEAKGTWRPLQVKASCRDCRVWARTGYVVK
jgi:VWFA-related protein